ncbi:MAG: HAD-IC family P-type ATPase [Firmicutes bacterium]|nr:HAD-IC family P-type ATPase [Bacillota bacterium]
MQGLTASEVKARTEAGLSNIQVDTQTRTVKEIVKGKVFTYFNLIFVVLGVLLILVGSFKDLTFLLIAAANTGVGIFQEIRSKNKLDQLRFLKMPRAHAIRDGAETEVPVEELVLDDVVILRAGNQIPADAQVSAGSIQVNEALLTGEADEITKNPGDRLLSGSFVVSGEAEAVLTAVGASSYISKLTLEATKDTQKDDSDMILSLDRLIKAIGIIIIPVGVIMLVQEWAVRGGTFQSSVISMVAAILGMIPEGLYMTASVAMVVSALRLAKNEVLVQNIECIESLARVDVLCVDKTGTITETGMHVEGMTQVTRALDERALNGLLGDFAAAQNADNATMEALKEHFTVRGERIASQVCPFSSRYKYSGCSFPDGNYVLGAPEYVLGVGISRYQNYIQEMSEKGYRVLAFCKTDCVPDGSALSGRAELYALLFFINPIRSSAPETFRFFAENGVTVKVISGDNPATVSKIAVQAGIPDGDHYLDARQLFNEKAISEAIERYTVFGRVTPEQKQMFVKALQEKGHTVGMTGDGVNDVLALRDADCSVAMASGSDAASNAAQLVLLDSDFGRMPSVVAEGRRVVNNIQKAASLYLTKNIFSLLLALFSMISVLTYPLKPSQITLISLFTIGAPSFILSLEPNLDQIRGRFLSNVFKMAAPAGITMFISVSAMVIFGQVFHIDEECISTSSTMLVALVGFLFLTKVAVPANKLHVGMMIALVCGMALCVIFMPGLFGIENITMRAAMLLIVFLIATEGLFRYVHKFVGVIARTIEFASEKKTAKKIRRREEIRARSRARRKERESAEAADDTEQ